ncbi:TetR/AcrR family transcriptional regulator [Rhodobacteraceae bacterium RKSG542]|uniref:TetR/AcrR family transcriptional regulator n=1 Tax=Pseudovibrio flavus TaxID=2529854 RepID=UPI0012BC3B01|nr:TetR/AcrR family transcriptional regulator [Pseudovibrio flavus]MTI16963.1 TetR/AcrR family transcriptional regulator [Pseudovibrio flavus]
MKKPIQQRTLKTRARLIECAHELIEAHGYAGLRIEDLVKCAGVAKGTFFAHFADKDALMELLIAERINQHLDAIEKAPTPRSVETVVSSLMPLLQFMACERYVFDVILRHSGAAQKEEVGAIAMTFDRQVRVVSHWLAEGPFRKDVPDRLLADGIQAFCVQTMALNFCALHNSIPMDEQLLPYLKAWLLEKVD